MENVTDDPSQLALSWSLAAGMYVRTKRVNNILQCSAARRWKCQTPCRVFISFFLICLFMSSLLCIAQDVLWKDLCITRSLRRCKTAGFRVVINAISLQSLFIACYIINQLDSRHKAVIIITPAWYNLIYCIIYTNGVTLQCQWSLYSSIVASFRTSSRSPSLLLH